MVFTPDHDHFQQATDDLWWNESSAAFMWAPEDKVGCWIYIWHRPNMNLSAATVAVWDPTAKYDREILFYHYYEFDKLGRDMFDFELECGLSCELLEPLTSRRYGFNGDGCELDVTYAAVVPPYEYLNPGQDEGVFDDLEGWGAKGHYSQGGKYQGTIKIGGRTYAVDSYGFFDRSWGPRRPPHLWARGGISACYSEKTSWDFWAVSQLPGDEDPFVDTTEIIGTGMICKDGVVSPIASGTRRITERNRDGDQMRCVLDAKDRLGREVHPRANV